VKYARRGNEGSIYGRGFNSRRLHEKGTGNFGYLVPFFMSPAARFHLGFAIGGQLPQFLPWLRQLFLTSSTQSY
jgi:hypothetical protein